MTFGNLLVLGAGFMILFIIISVLFFVFWLFMLVDCAKRKFKNDGEKAAWIIVVAIFGVLGAIVYYFAVKAGKDKSKNRGKK